MPTTRTSAASAPTDPVNTKAKNVNKSKTPKTAPPTSDTHVKPLPSHPADNSRPKRVTAKKPANANQTASQPVQQPTARKRQAGQKDHPPRIAPNAPELDSEVKDQPPAKRLKTKPVKDVAAQANPSSGKKKGTPNGSLQVAKENMPPAPTMAASKSKPKPTAAERHEQQVTETDNAGEDAFDVTSHQHRFLHAPSQLSRDALRNLKVRLNLN